MVQLSISSISWKVLRTENYVNNTLIGQATSRSMVSKLTSKQGCLVSKLVTLWLWLFLNHHPCKTYDEVGLPHVMTDTHTIISPSTMLTSLSPRKIQMVWIRLLLVVAKIHGEKQILNGSSPSACGLAPHFRAKIAKAYQRCIPAPIQEK